MDARELLQRLPPPDAGGEARVWRRFQETRQKGQRWKLPLSFALPLLAASAAAAALALLPERERNITLDASTDTLVHRWSDQVELKLAGHGIATGTAKDVVVRWETGTVWVEVEPNAGASLSVITDEAEISVVGTAFSVTRDALGATTEVTHGTVSVRCEDGWSGLLTAESSPHTCLPTRPAALSARAEALLERGAPRDLVLATIDRGLSVAESGSSYEQELLVRRIELLASLSRREEATADAERYLDSGGGRKTEVARAIGRLLLAEGCENALRWLEIAGSSEGADASDQVVLASCLVESAPARAVDLARQALSSGEPIEAQWKEWAQMLVEGGGR